MEIRRDSFNAKKSFLGSILFFIIVATIYLCFNRTWHIDGEAFPHIQEARYIVETKNYSLIFTKGNLATYYEIESSFFSRGLYFRPFTYMFWALQFKLFGHNGYHYFILTILLFAFSTALLFFILTFLFSNTLAWFLSLSFAFHPSLAYWFGEIDCQQSQFSLLFMLLTLLFLYLYLQKTQKKYLLLSVLSFAIAIFTRETYFILPFILLFTIPFFFKSFSLKQRALIASWFLIPISLYLFIRYYCYPPSLETSPLLATQSLPSLSTIFSHIKDGIRWFIQFCYDMFWRLWFPWDTYFYFKNNNYLFYYQILKSTILSIVCIFFITNKKRTYVILFGFISLLLHWLMIASTRIDPRLHFEALPFIIITLGYLFYYSSLWKHKIIKASLLSLFSLGIIVNAHLVIKSQQKLMYHPTKFENALIEFKKNTQTLLPSTNLIILNNPQFLGRQLFYYAAKLYDYSVDRPYIRSYYSDIAIQGDFEHVDKYIKCYFSEKEVTLFSTDPSVIWFGDSLNHRQKTVSFTLINQSKIAFAIWDEKNNSINLFYIKKIPTEDSFKLEPLFRKW